MHQLRAQRADDSAVRNEGTYARLKRLGLSDLRLPDPDLETECETEALMGVLLQGNFGCFRTVELTKAQFAAHPEVRRSRRWVELRVREGLPSRMDRNRRMFPLDEGLAWLKDHGWLGREKGAA